MVHRGAEQGLQLVLWCKDVGSLFLQLVCWCTGLGNPVPPPCGARGWRTGPSTLCCGGKPGIEWGLQCFWPLAPIMCNLV